MSEKGFTTETNASMKIALINELMTGPPAEFMLRKGGLFENRTDKSPKVHLLDNATGVGNLVFRFLDGIKRLNVNVDVDRVVGADIDDNYLSYLRTRADEKNYQIEALRLDQQSPGLDSESFTHIFSNFGVFFAPNDAAVLQETYRMLKGDGFAAFTSWAKLSWWDEVVVPALRQSFPDAPPLPHPMDVFRKTGWTDSENSEAKLVNAGFVNVQSEVYYYVPDMDPKDFAAAGSHLVKAMTGKAWDEDSRKRFEPLIEQAFYDYLINTFEGGRWPGKGSALVTWGWKKQV